MSLVNKVKINIIGYFSDMGTSEDIPEEILGAPLLILS